MAAIDLKELRKKLTQDKVLAFNKGLHEVGKKSNKISDAEKKKSFEYFVSSQQSELDKAGIDTDLAHDVRATEKAPRKRKNVGLEGKKDKRPREGEPSFIGDVDAEGEQMPLLGTEYQTPPNAEGIPRADEVPFNPSFGFSSSSGFLSKNVAAEWCQKAALPADRERIAKLTFPQAHDLSAQMLMGAVSHIGDLLDRSKNYYESTDKMYSRIGQLEAEVKKKDSQLALGRKIVEDAEKAIAEKALSDKTWSDKEQAWKAREAEFEKRLSELEPLKLSLTEENQVLKSENLHLKRKVADLRGFLSESEAETEALKQQIQDYGLNVVNACLDTFSQGFLKGQVAAPNSRPSEDDCDLDRATTLLNGKKVDYIFPELHGEPTTSLADDVSSPSAENADKEEGDVPAA